MCCLDVNRLHKSNITILPSRNVYSHKSEEINTLQADSSDNFMRFVHKVPTNFHISQYVVEIGMRWLWELQDLRGDSSWNYNLFKTSYCTLFLYEFFLTQVSHRRFLMRQYQYKFICHISDFFPTRVFFILRYLRHNTCHIFCFPPQGFLRRYQRHIITVMILISYLSFSKLGYGFFPV